MRKPPVTTPASGKLIVLLLLTALLLASCATPLPVLLPPQPIPPALKSADNVTSWQALSVRLEAWLLNAKRQATGLLHRPLNCADRRPQQGNCL